MEYRDGILRKNENPQILYNQDSKVLLASVCPMIIYPSRNSPSRLLYPDYDHVLLDPGLTKMPAGDLTSRVSVPFLTNWEAKYRFPTAVAPNYY